MIFHEERLCKECGEKVEVRKLCHKYGSFVSSTVEYFYCPKCKKVVDVCLVHLSGNAIHLTTSEFNETILRKFDKFILEFVPTQRLFDTFGSKKPFIIADKFAAYYKGFVFAKSEKHIDKMLQLIKLRDQFTPIENQRKKKFTYKTFKVVPWNLILSV